MELPHAHPHVVGESKELDPAIKRISSNGRKEKDTSMFSGVW
jgi:hypothetical protein